MHLHHINDLIQLQDVTVSNYHISEDNVLVLSCVQQRVNNLVLVAILKHLLFVKVAVKNYVKLDIYVVSIVKPFY